MPNGPVTWRSARSRGSPAERQPPSCCGWSWRPFARVRCTRALPHRSSAIWQRTTEVPWRSMLLTASVIVLFAGWVAALWPVYHVFGTDQTGNDVLFQAIKSIRTAVVIGSLATLATLPFADRVRHPRRLLQGLGGRCDPVPVHDALVDPVGPADRRLRAHDPGLRRQESADVRDRAAARGYPPVPAWRRSSGSPAGRRSRRLLRAETLKLSELDYVQAARAFGVVERRHHAAPHPAERDARRPDRRGPRFLRPRALRGGAVLRRRRRGSHDEQLRHDDQQRAQRDDRATRSVWWTLAAAFGFMVALVLSMQFFASAVNEAFDPRARAFRVRRPKPASRTPERPATAAVAASD